MQTDGDWSDLEELISDKLGEEAVEDPDAVVKKDKSKKKKKSDSPLAKLSPEELEKLGMKAVEEGVEPTKLQQAYASAQVPLKICTLLIFWIIPIDLIPDQRPLGGPGRVVRRCIGRGRRAWLLQEVE